MLEPAALPQNTSGGWYGIRDDIDVDSACDGRISTLFSKVLFSFRLLYLVVVSENASYISTPPRRPLASRHSSDVRQDACQDALW